MKYTQLGTTGLRVSRLGFGCMRLPMLPEGKVDRSLAIPLLHRAVEFGINYFDTAIGYCSGDSQRVLGEAFEKMREHIILSTKNHMYEAPPDAWWGRLEESLDLLRTSYIDVYNFHGLTWENYTRYVAGPKGKLKLMEKAREQGKIRFICCSFHDSAEALVKIAKTGVFSAITVQYNLLWRDLEDAIKRVHDLGVGIVVMGPVGGGRLGFPSDRIRQLTGGKVSSTPEAALRFVLANPGVTIALSGMSDVGMLEENVRIVSEKEPFTQDEIRTIEEETKHIREHIGVRCSACGYCKPCPAGVDIPGNFGVYNDYLIYGLLENSRRAYAELARNAAACIRCGACVPKCPQKINIPEFFEKVIAVLDPNYGSVLHSITIIGADGSTMKGRLTVKNLNNRSTKGTVSLHWDDKCTSIPKHVDFGLIPPFAARRRSLRVRIPDGVGILEGTTIFNGEANTASPFRLPLFLIPCNRMRTHRAKLMPQDFQGNAEFTAAHGYCVILSRDEEKIHVILDIRSQMHALSGIGEYSGSHMEIYVDMRSPGKDLPDAYTDGCEQFILCLREPGCPSRSGKKYTLNLRNERTFEGCRISLDFYFREFLAVGETIPSIIGLDFMFMAANEMGVELGYPTYGGRQGLYQRPELFTKAYLI